MGIDLRRGDCLELLADLPDESVDCILTDPPYGETSLGWDRWPEGWPAQVRRVLKRTGSMWVFGSQRMFMANAGEFAGWKLAQDIVWEKHNGTNMFADRFRRVHEMALHYYRDDAPWGGVYRKMQYTPDATKKTVRRKRRPEQWGAIGEGSYVSQDGGPRLMRSVIYARSEHGRAVHPTQKPLAIVEPLLRYACPIGGTVLDIFAGSGTTGVAAQLNGMSAILMEGNDVFADACLARLAEGAAFEEMLA